MVSMRVLGLLAAVDKEPNDIRFAIGQTINQPLDDMLNLYVIAVRVVGTPADMLVEPLVRILSGTPRDEWPPEAGTARNTPLSVLQTAGPRFKSECRLHFPKREMARFGLTVASSVWA